MFVSQHLHRQLRLIIALGIALPLLAFGPIHSGLNIEPRQQFVLGGGQQGAFQVKGKNTGPVPVRVIERFASGDTLGRGMVVPGAKAVLKFQRGSAAVLVNASNVSAHLDLVISGDVRLGMTYEGVSAK